MAERESTQVGEIHALLARGTKFKGTLAFSGRARIDGKLDGEVVGEGILVVGEGADIDAKIEVGTLIVLGGTLRGSATARQLIEIHAPARVLADITAPEIDVAKGATFEGRCTMTGPAAADPKDVESASEGAGT